MRTVSAAWHIGAAFRGGRWTATGKGPNGRRRPSTAGVLWLGMVLEAGLEPAPVLPD